MRVFETTATVGPDRKLVIDLPTDVEPGTHRVVVVLEGDAEPSSPPDFRSGWPRHDTPLPARDGPDATQA